MMNNREISPRILAVDDKPQNLYALDKLLDKLNVEVCHATSGFEALALSLEMEFCLAIVDVQMPQMDGYELVELLRGNPATAQLPIIFVSAIYSDEYHHRKGYDTGAVDFLSKPFIPEILMSKVKVFLDLYHQRLKLEELIRQLHTKNQALQTEISQRHQAESALRRANADKDKLFAIISHDLRGPFQPLLGNAQLILKRGDKFNQADILAMVQDIYNSGRAVYTLLENLLTWSRLQQGRLDYRPEEVDLAVLAGRTVTLLDETARGKQITLAQQIETGLMVQADQYMIETVIRNLTSNALKFTPVGGQVILTALRDGLRADSADHWVEVRVSDTGMGMNPDEVDKLFRLDVPHSTVGTAQETGTGLGLILCQEMVQKNGGRIWVQSEKGKGTTVTFTLPEIYHTPTKLEIRN